MTIDDVNAQFDTLQAAVTKEEADVTTYVAALKAQVAAGGPVTQAQLDALGAKFSGITNTVTQFDINTTAPPAPVPPIPPAARATK
jgi:hypothetical protein